MVYNLYSLSFKQDLHASKGDLLISDDIATENTETDGGTDDVMTSFVTDDMEMLAV